MSHKGVFILADTSGYSQYLDSAGLAHASKVTAKLLNALIEADKKYCRVVNLEGDAVFFLCPDAPPEQLVNHLLHLFEAFFNRMLEIGQDTDCGCGACGGANQLALKFIVHAGEYAEQRVGRRRELVGPEVVVAHRLLKAGCRWPEYILLTRDYLGGRTLQGYDEEEGELELASSSVRFVALDLTRWRRQLEVKHGVFIEPQRAQAQAEVDIAAPPGAVWETMLSAEELRLWTGASEVYSYPARMGTVGSVFRLVFPDGRDFAQIVLGIDDERRRVTFRRSGTRFTGHIYSTYEVNSGGDEGAKVSCQLAADTSLPSVAKLLPLPGIERYGAEAASGLERLKTYCEAGRG